MYNLYNSGEYKTIQKIMKRKGVCPMNKMAIAAIGLGAAYLMRNKEARDKLMKQFGSLTGAMGMMKNS